jgi:hypothetical protein
MRSVVVAIATAATALWVTKASAASLLDCNNTDTAYRTVCDEQELRKLGGEIDDELARLLRGADPLTALLLKRDQVYFADVLGADNIPRFQSHNDKSYSRVLAALKARSRALTGLRVGSVTTLEGDWSNVFANMTIAKGKTGALTIAIKSRLSYPNVTRGEVDCAAMVTATPGDDGWYSAAIGDKDFEGRLDLVRQHKHPVALAHLKPASARCADNPSARLVAEKYCEMPPRFFALDDVNAVFDEGANSRASVLPELLVADRYRELACLVSDPIMMTPIALYSGVARQRGMIDPRPGDTPPHVQIRAASILPGPNTMPINKVIASISYTGGLSRSCCLLLCFPFRPQCVQV